jgi:hypothetical protein
MLVTRRELKESLEPSAADTTLIGLFLEFPTADQRAASLRSPAASLRAPRRGPPNLATLQSEPPTLEDIAAPNPAIRSRAWVVSVSLGRALSRCPTGGKRHKVRNSGRHFQRLLHWSIREIRASPRPANNSTYVQLKDLRAQATRPADELPEHDFGRKRMRATRTSLETETPSSQSVTATRAISGVKAPDRRKSVTRTDGNSSKLHRLEIYQIPRLAASGKRSRCPRPTRSLKARNRKT